MHLNSAGCIFRWRDWAVTCNISQQEKHFGEAVILRFSAYFLLGFNKKVVSKWLGEKTQSLDKIFTWHKKFFKTKILADYYNIQGMALWTQRDQLHLVYFLERRKLGSTQSHLKCTSDRTGCLVGHLFLKILTSRAATSGGRAGYIRVWRDFSAASMSWNRQKHFSKHSHTHTHRAPLIAYLYISNLLLHLFCAYTV